MILRCKMCGADLSVVPGMEFCECESCGTKQTLPKFDDEKRITMYERANHFRRNNEFDKAMGMYEQILNEDRTDAEAYWSIVLCRYGIQYVEDPGTHKRIPTVNRSQYASIFADEDYKEAINNATLAQKVIFEDEAKKIDEIQKGILEISSKEEPFDVFICYKESDANGNRTVDSVIANDVYHQLKQEGFKVFFAAITLEDKLGKAYEPYIFAALNSAKVMIVLGTKPEYFNAVWVKNEWSRFLAIIKNDPSKILIPAYRDMDAYDLPEEFSFLQAQDMSKIGFIQDLIRGIRKVIGSGKDIKQVQGNVVPVVKQAPDDETTLEGKLKRAYFYIEDANWSNALLYCKRALDSDPACAKAYVGQLLVELRLRKFDDLKKQLHSFTKNENYMRACRYANEDLKKELTAINDEVNANIVTELNKQFEEAKTEGQLEKLMKSAEQVLFLDGMSELIEKCQERKVKFRKEMMYASACQIMNAPTRSMEDYLKVEQMLTQLGDYEDCPQLMDRLQEEMIAKEASETSCAICKKYDGKHKFVPGYDFKCCDRCWYQTDVLCRQRGSESNSANNAVEYFDEKLPAIRSKLVANRIREIMKKYIDSVPGLGESKFQEVNLSEDVTPVVREKTEWEIMEEKEREEKRKRQEEAERRAQIERIKQSVLKKNAVYEYETVVVSNKITGGSDTDGIRMEISEKAAAGWRLHSTIYNQENMGTFIGQTVLIFERRIKEQQI